MSGSGHHLKLARLLSLSIRAVHSESSDYFVALQPPRTEARRVHVTPILSSVSTLCVAPELVRQIEDVGKEIRDVLKRLGFTSDTTGEILSLLDRIVPMFDAAPFTEEHIVIVRRVAPCINTGGPGLQKLIDDDAVLYLQSRCRSDFSYGRHTDPCHDQIRLQPRAGGKRHGVGADRFDTGDGCKMNAS